MSTKTRKYIYRVMMALGVFLTGVGIVKQEIVAAAMPLITAVLALADANVPDEDDNADAR
nr:MAG TPA: Mycobacterial 2 TMS Phage Holin (M2 Hol) Family [Bacteriophage sp.]